MTSLPVAGSASVPGGENGVEGSGLGVDVVVDDHDGDNADDGIGTPAAGVMM